MKNLFLITLILFSLASCNDSGGGSSAASSGSAPSCDPFALADDMIAVQYTGTTVTTVGTCDNAGQEYIITTDADYTFPGTSATGWRLLNSDLTTNAGNISFATGGRFQTTDGVNEGHGLDFAGIDHTTCQNALTVNGSTDGFEIHVTAEFDSDCVPRLRGTFREYSICVDSSKVTICSGTITLER